MPKHVWEERKEETEAGCSCPSLLKYQGVRERRARRGVAEQKGNTESSPQRQETQLLVSPPPVSPCVTRPGQVPQVPQPLQASAVVSSVKLGGQSNLDSSRAQERCEQKGQRACAVLRWLGHHLKYRQLCRQRVPTTAYAEDRKHRTPDSGYFQGRRRQRGGQAHRPLTSTYNTHGLGALASRAENLEIPAGTA